MKRKIIIPLLLITIAVGVIFLKGSLAALAALLIGCPLRVAAIAGVSLSQIGEFSFVLAKTGRELGIGSEENYQIFLSVAVLTMGITPYLMHHAPRFAHLLLKMPFPERLKSGYHPDADKNPHDE